MTRRVCLVVHIDNDMELPHAMEVLARHCAGLVMDGTDAWIQVETVEQDADEHDDA